MAQTTIYFKSKEEKEALFKFIDKKHHLPFGTYIKKHIKDEMDKENRKEIESESLEDDI